MIYRKDFIWHMKRISQFIFIELIILILFTSAVSASDVPRSDTPDYKVSFFPYDCFNIQDEDGTRSGYGYDMMQYVSRYSQCTFTYVGYDKTAAECVEMLDSGELDIYTAAKKTKEREEKYVFSRHPSITAVTCMNVKVGNKDVVAGDYSTYDGLRIGLLRRHTYNGKFEDFAASKGFSYTIMYYDTPTDLRNALIEGKVDAVVNSYIATPEDEQVIEQFEETPYYIMALKENQEIIDTIDEAIDTMNIEMPNWRTELYNEYYGTVNVSEYTPDEKSLLTELQKSGTVIKAVMNPDANPYSWYDDDGAHGIAVDMFTEIVGRLGLKYEIIPVSTYEEYQDALASGNVDVWIDVSGYYDNNDYQITSSYLTTTMSSLHRADHVGAVNSVVITSDNTDIRKIVTQMWPNAEVTVVNDPDDCVKMVMNSQVDSALLMTYKAQRFVKEDARNRLQSDIVPGVQLNLYMGINSDIDYRFYGLWNKTLTSVAEQTGAEVVQQYLDTTIVPTFIEYMYTHPVYLVVSVSVLFLIIFLIVLYLQSVKSKNKQSRISQELAVALDDAREAYESKQNFFSKMSHDIRTPLNAVLGMTQVAKKYIDDKGKLENSIDVIESEGQYLLGMINSILDVNQLEHGHMELTNVDFSPAECVNRTVDILRPLAVKRKQTITVECGCDGEYVIGDGARYSQIIVNVVSNAVKYTNIGGDVYISINNIGDNVYRFICKDNGIGMTEEFISHIYDEYVRAEDSRISKTEGTGLGMSVVKGFTDLMHGTVTIKSKPGIGSTFIIDIPFEREDEEHRLNRIASVNDAVSDVEGKGYRVLLVEDNELNAEIAIELMQSIGLIVDWAENGSVGVERFMQSAEGYYYAIFMDMQMPVMDGVKATQLIRHSNRSDNNIPVYAITANTLSDDRNKCMEAGMTGYITKPISVKSIMGVLNGQK